MGGQAGVRGYVVQALACVLDALRYDNSWIGLTIEPSESGDKVDILWMYPKRKLAVQIKSSENQIGLADVKRWATELAQPGTADEYALQLLGPCAQGVTSAGAIGPVKILPPHPLNVDGLVEQAAHKLGIYLEERGLTPASSQARELLALALISKLTNYSTSGSLVARERFDAQLTEWARECGAQPANHSEPVDLPALHQLVRPLPDLTGRSGLLEDLLVAVRLGTVAAINIWGMGGVGKTAFSSLLADSLSQTYADAQLLFTFGRENAVRWQHAAAHVIRSFHPRARVPDSDASLLSLYRSVLHGKRILLLLDNVETREQCEPLLAAGNGLYIITSRARMSLPGVESRELDVLTPSDARAFLARACARIGDYADHIARLCGNLPLALRLAASAMDQRGDISPREYVERLSSLEERLAFVDAAITLSYELLPRIQQRFWSILSLFPSTFTVDAASRITGAGEERTKEWLANLRNLSLVLRDDRSGRYGMHDLYAVYASSRLTESDGSIAAMVFVEYFAHQLSNANVTYGLGGSSACEALRTFETEWPNIQKAFALAEANAADDPKVAAICAKFPLAGINCLRMRLRPSDVVRWCEIALNAAEGACGLTNEVAQLHHCMVGELKTLGRIDDASRSLEHVHKAAIANGDQKLVAATLISLATLNAHRGDMKRARSLAEDAEALVQTHGLEKIGVLIGRSAISLLSREWAIARDRASEAAELARARGSASEEADALCNVAASYAGERRYEDSIRVSTLALAKAREVGYLSTEKDLVGNIGVSHLELGRAGEAIPWIETQMTIALDEGDKVSQCNALINLGRAHHELGRDDVAERVTSEALEIARALGDPHVESLIQWNIGAHYEDRGDLDSALAAAERCAELQRLVGDPLILETEVRLRRIQAKLEARHSGKPGD